MNLNKLKKEINQLKNTIPSMERYENLYNEFIDDYNRRYVTKETPDNITKVMYYKVNPVLSDADKQVIWDTITRMKVNDIETLRRMEPIRKIILRLMEYPIPVLNKDDDFNQWDSNREIDYRFPEDY